LKPGLEDQRVRLPALRFAFLLAAGLLLAGLARDWWPVFAAALPVSSLLSVFFRSKNFGKICGEAAFFLVVACCAFGLLELDRRVKRAESLRKFPLDCPVALQGRVEGPGWRLGGPVYDGTRRRRCVFRAEAFYAGGRSNWLRCDSRLLLTLPDDEHIPLNGNERLALIAVVKKPSGYANPGGFDWRKYLLERSIAAEASVEDPQDVRLLGPGKSGPGDYLNPVRWASWLRAAVFERHGLLYRDNRVRAVASALLLGAREQLPRFVREDFINSGTMHVLVVSGLHVGFIAGALFLVFSLVLGRGWACSLTVTGAVLVFALVCGGRPSVVRAALMCAFVLVALPLQRRKFLLNSLAAAFSVMLLARPDWLADIGFQLSFAAVTGIGLLVPRLEKIFHGRPWWQRRPARWLVRIVLASLAAQAAVTPLIACHFMRISPVAVAANLLIVPLACAAVITGFITDILVFISVSAAGVTAWLFDILTNALLYLARFFSSLPAASFDISPPSLPGIALWWLAAFFAAAALTERKHLLSLGLVCLLWLNLHIWLPVFGPAGDELRIRFLDVGDRGHAVVLHCPGGKALFLDAGPARGGLPAREVVIPYLVRYCDGRIDRLVLRKCSRAGIAACSLILDRVKVGSLVVPPVVSGAPFYRDFLDECLARSVALRAPVARDTVDLGRTRLIILGPERYFYDIPGRLGNASEADLAQLIEYDGRSILLAGALDERRLGPAHGYLRAAPACSVLEWPARLARTGGSHLLSKLVSSGRGPIVIAGGESYENLAKLEKSKYAGERGIRRLSTTVHGSIGLSIRKGGGVEVRTELGYGQGLSGK